MVSLRMIDKDPRDDRTFSGQRPSEGAMRFVSQLGIARETALRSAYSSRRAMISG